eukprot:CAMPEP_0177359526 /NCGR_PEP_ID=MMETSP0368-20130122/36165_1 /TAXON_ID=447022 ORGANISM="Scrippsiella hangoei-like, Strain SHHI-4" /NCGR_SAMPLE_ID=MMETSP0368 /ASSEMBLY_ACC=CAM_ASM_000363 /LENGTH=55 /DNA_ID=CAMNT_0018822049 /DNA_START=122 /DNA_END=285 /DNA_ORIENTATION=+
MTWALPMAESSCTSGNGGDATTVDTEAREEASSTTTGGEARESRRSAKRTWMPSS